MRPRWQFFNGECHPCHWWQDQSERRITAMDIILGTIFLVIALGLLVDWVRADAFAGLPRRLHHRH